MEDNQPRKSLKNRLQSPITIDLSQRRHRRLLLISIVAIGLFSIAFLIGNIKIYQYSESSEFCGTACHPMDPQWIRYEFSSHANVECVHCHIGPGFVYFIQSKIAGTRQLYGVLTNSYSRPILSPVHNLRPARETCEECHSPTTFTDNIIKTITHYDNDEFNTPVRSTLILKMGGWQENGIALGIHWHVTNRVFYIAADHQRQVILWVGVEQDDGSLVEYFSRDTLTIAQTNFVDEAMENGELREMDCIDCHNRTAHYIPYPTEVVDNAITDGIISRDIPYIRANAVEIFSQTYETTEEGHQAIQALTEFYAENYASRWNDSADLLQPLVLETIEELIRMFDQTTFPDMELNWAVNPNNSRHTPTLGCFRCHDGNHVNVDETGQEAQVISVECNLCHTVPIVGRGEELLIEAPVIVGQVPETHADFSWTIEHRDITVEEEVACLNCHGTGFCNNGVCHNLNHPVDMVFTHAEEFENVGSETCYTCHQNIHCTRCHAGGIIDAP